MEIKDILDFIRGKKTRRIIHKDRRKLVYYRDLGICCHCGKKIKYKEMEVDHITPVSHGGNDYIFNLRCSCRRCNRSRSNKEWIRPKRKLHLWQKIFGIILAIYYWDIPEGKDYV